MADETEQTEIPVEAVAAPEPVVEPVADVAPAIEPAPEQADAPAVNTDSPLFSHFRKLWHGGERRAAVEWAKAMEVAEDEWAALMGEFPELLDIINGN